MRDYWLNVNDQETNPIGVQYFYRNYVSQSIPVVLKNEARNWRFKLLLESATKAGDELDFLTQMFRSRVVGWDLTNPIGALIEYQRLTKKDGQENQNFT